MHAEQLNRYKSGNLDRLSVVDHFEGGDIFYDGGSQKKNNDAGFTGIFGGKQQVVVVKDNGVDFGKMTNA